MREKLLYGGLIFLTVYMITPWVLTRVFGIGVLRKGKRPGQIAFTFDDGPDPVYTPKLLEMLRKHNVKATFFVLGSKAECYPELIRSIHQDGHLIGVHNYTHKSNWLMAPWTVFDKHVTRSADIVEAITGERPIYYRPPWGIINIFDFWLKRRYRIVLWSLMGRDWNRDISKTKLRNKLLDRMKDGSVVLLHDSGDTFGADADAPYFMLQALDDVLAEAANRGLSCVRIDEMFEERDNKFATRRSVVAAETAAALSSSGTPAASPQTAAAARSSRKVSPLSTGKRALVYVWMLWERCFIRLFHIEVIDQSNPLLRLRVREYSSSYPILLEDGESIRKGDRIAELHLDNDMLFKLGHDSRTSVHLAIQIIRRVEQLMPQILHLLETDPAYRDVKGLYGISMIHRGTKQLGFTVQDLPKGLFTRLTQWYLRILMAVIHPQGKERLKTKSELLVPKIIAISKKELMSRYIA
ncbi:polysaccharide deacetylase family protein [Paenibacillus sp. MBLB4367]|uniref:polysaccharide deacetylase family protein n=1 Tax=Paenibacillus sp. MBLB4367 TaxID=3384767 RepID=UPI00390820BC